MKVGPSACVMVALKVDSKAALMVGKMDATKAGSMAGGKADLTAEMMVH